MSDDSVRTFNILHIQLQDAVKITEIQFQEWIKNRKEATELLSTMLNHSDQISCVQKVLVIIVYCTICCYRIFGNTLCINFIMCMCSVIYTGILYVLFLINNSPVLLLFHKT